MKPTPPPAGFPSDLSLIYDSLRSNGNYSDHLQHSANRSKPLALGKTYSIHLNVEELLKLIRCELKKKG